jgi:hypothetical protein
MGMKVYMNDDDKEDIIQSITGATCVITMIRDDKHDMIRSSI